ncbi:DUF3783 domain-containing protein [Hippea jasoniae]|uniref:DUF3783 domain-containing protein n=1 Tax=Hippea jasoniae TaxID=944479 RepID=UPI00068EE570|nr:DUF3783 domain-containing protein [Hippea jasoniae]
MEAIKNDDKKLFGDFAVLACGLDEDKHRAFLSVAKDFSGDLKVVFAADGSENKTLSELFKLDDLYGFLKPSLMPKALIMSGFRQNQLLEFIEKVKHALIGFELMAVLTPISVKWKLSDLLNELKKEAEEFKRRRENERDDKKSTT